MEQIEKMLQGYECLHCGKPNLLKFTTICGPCVMENFTDEKGEMIRHVCEPSSE